MALIRLSISFFRRRSNDYWLTYGLIHCSIQSQRLIRSLIHFRRSWPTGDLKVWIVDWTFRAILDDLPLISPSTLAEAKVLILLIDPFGGRKIEIVLVICFDWKCWLDGGPKFNQKIQSKFYQGTERNCTKVKILLTELWLAFVLWNTERLFGHSAERKEKRFPEQSLTFEKRERLNKSWLTNRRVCSLQTRHYSNRSRFKNSHGKRRDRDSVWRMIRITVLVITG